MVWVGFRLAPEPEPEPDRPRAESDPVYRRTEMRLRRFKWCDADAEAEAECAEGDAVGGAWLTEPSLVRFEEKLLLRRSNELNAACRR